jgi:glycosyl transferase, family 25
MNKLLDQFECIYIINLASRADRRTEIEEQLRRIGLSLNSPRVVLFNAVRVNDAEGFPTAGARGCFLSHLGVLEDAANRSLSSVLILEDDVNFVDDFLARSNELAHALSTVAFELFYGGHQFVLAPSPHGGRGWVDVAPAELVGLSHFIGLKGESVRKASVYLKEILTRAPGDPAGGPMHVDGAYNWFRQAHPNFRTVAAMPEIGYQRASRTDVHELAWYDRLPLIRDLAVTLRRRRNA